MLLTTVRALHKIWQRQKSLGVVFWCELVALTRIPFLTCIHMSYYTRIHPHTYVYICVLRIYTYIHTYIHICICIYVYMYMYTCISTPTYTCTQLPSSIPDLCEHSGSGSCHLRGRLRWAGGHGPAEPPRGCHRPEELGLDEEPGSLFV